MQRIVYNGVKRVNIASRGLCSIRPPNSLCLQMPSSSFRFIRKRLTSTCRLSVLNCDFLFHIISKDKDNFQPVFRAISCKENFNNAKWRKVDNSFPRSLHQTPMRALSMSSVRFSKENNENKQDGDEQNQYSWTQFIPLVILGMFYFLTSNTDPVPETSWTVFYREMLSKGEVVRLEVSSSRDKVYIFLHPDASINGKKIQAYGPHFSFTISSVESFEEKMIMAQKEIGISERDFIPVKYKPISDTMNIIFSALTTIAIFGVIWYFLFGRKSSGGGKSMFGNPFNAYTRAKAIVIEPGTPRDISFKDVAGMTEAKQEVKEFVDYLQDSDRFLRLGAKIPKGALLVGPPGTGKTLLAKAVATEAGVPFLSMAGSDFVEMFAGVGSARVRDLFKQAAERASCIVYIDEIDAIGKSRKSSSSGGGNSEQENTLNQLLVEMDGINTIEGVVLLASTNRSDVLDQALLRPGRFDRLITIDLPTLPERKSIFEIYLRQLQLRRPLQHYSRRLAELTPGKSGADIANVCNEAALHAARLNARRVDTDNFEYAVERIIAGMEKRNNPLSPEERKIVSYHEAGHAIVGWMLEHTDPILKISIVPRTNSVLGFTQRMPLDFKLHTSEQLFDMMCMTLGGRVAESIVFKRITTNGEDDLRTVTNMAYQQIVHFGMNETVGPLSFPMRNRNDVSIRPYSDKLARTIDQEANKLVHKAFEATEKVVLENETKLNALANALLDNEVVDYDQLVELIGMPAYGDKRHLFDNLSSVREKTKVDETVAPC